MNRKIISHYNDIRGVLPKFAGSVLSQSPIDLTSGDIVKCFGKYSEDAEKFAFDLLKKAEKSDFFSYSYPVYKKTQTSIWNYLVGGLDSNNIHMRAYPINGISEFMPTALRISAFSLGTKPLFVIIPPIHPHWIASIISEFGFENIEIIKRTSDGLPDLEDAKKLKKIDRSLVFIISPDENPTGVCTPNKFFDPKNGIFSYAKKPYIVLFDAIYMDAAWGPNANKRYELFERLNHTLVMHSLSKIWAFPGIRAGGVAYVGEEDEVGKKIMLGLQISSDGKIASGVSSLNAEILNGIYSYSESAINLRLKMIELLEKRVVENEGIINQGLISKKYPNSVLEAALYGLHKIDGLTKWHDEKYQKEVLTKAIHKIGENDFGLKLRLDAFMEVASKFGISPSMAFSIELALNGALVLPIDPFLPFGYKEEEITFRTVLAYEKKVILEAYERISKLLND